MPGIWALKHEGRGDPERPTATAWRSTRGSTCRKTDSLLVKKYASCFFGTDLVPRLLSQRVDTVDHRRLHHQRAACAPPRSTLCRTGLRPMVVREAVGDRSAAAHEQSLFDLNAKYADVVGLDETLQYHEDGRAQSGLQDALNQSL